MTQEVRAIDWTADPTDAVVRKLRAAEGHPGVLDTMHGTEFHLFGVHRERELRGAPGAIVAQRDGAICRATTDGAVWITHLKRREGGTSFKLPATRALELSPASRSTRPRSRSRWTRRCPPSTPSARSPTRSTRTSATCTSTSTTAR